MGHRRPLRRDVRGCRPELGADEVAATLVELSGSHDEVPAADSANLRDKLDALHQDGVVHRFDDASRAGDRRSL